MPPLGDECDMPDSGSTASDRFQQTFTGNCSRKGRLPQVHKNLLQFERKPSNMYDMRLYKLTPRMAELNRVPHRFITASAGTNRHVGPRTNPQRHNAVLHQLLSLPKKFLSFAHFRQGQKLGLPVSQFKLENDF